MPSTECRSFGAHCKTGSYGHCLRNRHQPTAKANAPLNELRRTVRQMSDWAEGRTPQSFQQRDLIPLMAQWAEPIEVEPALPTLGSGRAFRPTPMPADAVAAAQRFDAAIEKPDSAEFLKWMAELPAAFDAYAELRLARRMAARPELDWSNVRLALKTRRLAERVAAETLASGLWTREQIEHADRFGCRANVDCSPACGRAMRASLSSCWGTKDEYEQASASESRRSSPQASDERGECFAFPTICVGRLRRRPTPIRSLPTCRRWSNCCACLMQHCRSSIARLRRVCPTFDAYGMCSTMFWADCGSGIWQAMVPATQQAEAAAVRRNRQDWTAAALRIAFGGVARLVA